MQDDYPPRGYAWTVVAILIATAVISYTDRQVLSLLVDPIRAELITTVEQSVADGVRDADALEHIVRRTVGRWVDQTYRRRPMLMPTVLEV